jgi:hypothetical protein
MRRFIRLFGRARDYSLEFTVARKHASALSRIFTAVAW